MKEERILRVLGEVDETYIAEAAPKEAKRKRPMLRKLMIAAACLLLLLTMGCAAAAVSPEVRAAVQSIIEILFPPKEVTVTPEGLPESVPHTAQGQEPAGDAPGFAIYVDEDRYEMTEEDGAFFIRPKKSPLSREDIRQNDAALLEGLTAEEQEAFIDDRLAEQEAFYAALPPCEMEIREEEGTDVEAAAAAARAEMVQTWETVTEIGHEDRRLSFSASGGTAWDAPRETHYFYPGGEGRVYHIIIRCYLEAEEGHGARFRTMLETFSVLVPSSATQPQVNTAAGSMGPDREARKTCAAAADISGTGTVCYVGHDAWGTDPLDEADYTAWLEEHHGNTSELEIEYLLLTEENILTCEANRDSENRTWQSAYLEIIHHLDEYLAPIYGGNGVNSRSYIDPTDIQIYLGIHDFDDDDTFELIVGDTLTMAVFTYKDGQIEKIADLYDPNAEWCINGVHFKDNSISVNCDGAGGSDFVNFGYLDGKYVLGLYNAINLSEVTINGKESTLEEMNRIYTLDWNERSETERKNRIRLVKDNEAWVLKYQSGAEVVLDSNFDFNSILW